MQTSQESRADVTTKAIYDISKAIAGRFQLEDLLIGGVSKMTKPRKILIIEDDSNAREEIGRMFSTDEQC